jgi:hypothetical protein
MNLKTLSKIKRELLQIYKSPQGRKALEFESFAKQLGRYKDNRGKEPTYTRERDAALAPPLSIPNHGDLKIGTARSIVNTLLNDVDEWEIYLKENEDNDYF